MILSRIQSVLPGFNFFSGRRRFRDAPVRNLPVAQKREVSPVRLVGYFVGGILLANLVLMTSSAFRGHAAERALGSAIPETRMQTEAQTDALAPREEADAEPESPQPIIANICADAREKLVAGLTLYYLQRSRRPNASNDEVLESTGASALLAGPTDPAAMPPGVPCAG